jgi:hypothetical protein
MSSGGAKLGNIEPGMILLTQLAKSDHLSWERSVGTFSQRIAQDKCGNIDLT